MNTLSVWIGLGNLRHYQQMPRSNGQDMDRLQAPFQAMALSKLVAGTMLQFLQV